MIQWYRFADTIIIIKSNPKTSEEDFWGFIHPVYAWILNLFDGKTEESSICKTISCKLGVSEEVANNVIRLIKGNSSKSYLSYDGVISVIPPHVIVESNSAKREKCSDNTFIIKQPIDHKSFRWAKPRNLLICPTLACFTDCIYCYANKKEKHVEISYRTWIRLIHQAKKNGVERIDVTGGEFFLKEGWQKIAQSLTKNGYFPDISTKIPLSKFVIDDIVDSGLKSIQFSLDTLDSIVASKTLCVDVNYTKKMQNSIRYADLKGLKVILKPTLSVNTCNENNLQSIFTFASSLSNINRVVISIIGFSNFKGHENYKKIRPSLSQICKIRSFIRDMSDKMVFPIIDDTFIYRKCEMKNASSFSNRPLCSANIDGFVILPDGNVTICEELYWNPFFQLGNIQNKSILEIWNSDKAKSLYFQNQEKYPESSACKNCQNFIACRTKKGVCWKIIVAAYGNDNTLYPDPRCPFAPDTNVNYTID